MISLQSSGVNGSKFDAPQTDRFSGYGDASLRQEVFDISVAEVETIVEPDGIGDNIWRESVALVSIHRPILSTSAQLTWRYLLLLLNRSAIF